MTLAKRFTVRQKLEEHSATILICVGLLIATVAAHFPVISNGFINYDDTDYVTQNPHVTGGLSWQNIAWAFQTFHASNWHPLTWLSLILDAEVFGSGPEGFHATNLLLHALNAVMLFLLLKRLTGACWSSAAVAALFGLHPVHVESVAWIAERKDVLSGFFWMLTLLSYARYAEETFNKGGKRRIIYFATLVSFAAGLMAKPMLVTLPFVMLLLDFWPLQRIRVSRCSFSSAESRQVVLEKLPMFVLSVASSWVTSLAQRGAMQPLEQLPLPVRIENAVVGYVRYLGKAVLPTNLALPYLHPGHWPASIVVLACVVLLAVTAGAVIWLNSKPYVAVGWFWYLGTLVPVIGLVQVGAQSLADRYTYLPLIGIFVMIVWLVRDFVEQTRSLRTPVAAITAMVLVTFGGLTWCQAAHWRNSETLFKHAAEVTENNFIALGNVGGFLFENGRLDEAMEFYLRSYQANPRYAEALNSIGAIYAARGSNEVAIAWFNKALDAQPDHAQALFNLGNAMAKRGDNERAARYFEASLKAEPDNFEAENNLANALVNMRRIDDAIRHYQLALSQNPKAPMIHKNLGEMLAARGRLDEAIGHYREALSLTNDAGTHYSLGLTLAVQGKWNEAIEEYQSALRLSPSNPEAHYNLGYAQRVMGKLDDAALQFGEALRLKSDFPLAHFNLACVLIEKGSQDEAQRHLQEALRLKPDYAEAQAKLKSISAVNSEHSQELSK